MSDQLHTGKIVIVEDEPKLAHLIIDYLKADNFDTFWLREIRDVTASIEEHKPALILLDVMLPGKNGFELCKDIRHFSQVPIIMVSARGGEQDCLRGFDLGADDYICKPFSPRELVSRVKAILKRANPGSLSLAPTGPKLDMDLEFYTATLNGQALDLTPLEFRLLATLSQSPGRVFTRGELLDRVYPGHRIINDRTIDSHIKNLRHKLKVNDSDDEIVHSIYGVGYKFEVQAQN